MTNEFFEALQQWQQDQSGRRQVDIEFGAPYDRNKVKVWLYDYDAMCGAHVSSIEDLEALDLKEITRKSLECQMKRLEAA